jgi:predicted  nucleic acid-binding Zn-ribbon protein
MSAHTPTPWSNDGNNIQFWTDRGLMFIAECEEQVDAARIVQCVNACEGMDDPEKEIKIMLELESKFKEDLKRANERGDSNRKMMVEQSEMNVTMKRELESLRAENDKLELVQTDLVFENQVYRGQIESLRAERDGLVEALRATLPILNDVVHPRIDWVRGTVRTTLAKYEK